MLSSFCDSVQVRGSLLSSRREDCESDYTHRVEHELAALLLLAARLLHTMPNIATLASIPR